MSWAPITKLRSLPPVFWTVRVWVSRSGMLRLALREAGVEPMSGASRPAPVRFTMSVGVSGSFDVMAKVAGILPGAGGLKLTNRTAFPWGGTLKLVRSTP